MRILLMGDNFFTEYELCQELKTAIFRTPEQARLSYSGIKRYFFLLNNFPNKFHKRCPR